MNSPRPLVLALDTITPADEPFVGGKAFNCARLKQAGIAVPDGRVLITDAMGTLELPDLQRWLSGLAADARLAVRSSGVEEDSAGHSFAGIHETTLNVRPADVPEAIRSCWASVTSPQAIAYRRAQNLESKNPRTAVLVQIMVDAAVSGVAFTIHPVTGNKDELVINSTFGLGEELVSGRVEPDEFHVRKSDRKIISTHVAGDRSSLSEDLVCEFTDVLFRIERHYGTAQDVEWCYDGRQFWIVQSRPITAAPASTRKKDTEWTRANMREIFPDLPPPMIVYSTINWVSQGQRRYYGHLLGPEGELGPTLTAFNGRLYFNVDQLRYMCNAAGTPPSSVLRAFGHEGEIEPEDEVVQRLPLGQTLQCIPDIARIVFSMLTIRGRVSPGIEQVDRDVRRLRAMDFRKLSDLDLWNANRDWRPKYIDWLQVIFTLAGVCAYERSLQVICDSVGMPYERLCHTFLAAGEKSVSSEQAFDLLRLVRSMRKRGGDLSGEEFKKEFGEFLELYGHRGRYESDVSQPRYAEDPSPLLFAIETHLQSENPPDPDEIIQRQNAEANKAWLEFEARLSFLQRFTVAPRARWLLRRIKQFYIWRERLRSEFIRIAYPLRLAHLELGRRFAERGWIPSQGDYFYLKLEEVDGIVDGVVPGSSLAAIVAGRKADWARYAKIDMPLLLRESQLPTIARQAPAVLQPGTVSELRGLAVSPGFAEGKVIVMNDASEFAQMKRGAILVAPATDPSWTPLFTLASGVIVEVGGILSHASTVAREYGLPALANVKHATKILKNGDFVRLDAVNGVVEILDQSKF